MAKEQDDSQTTEDKDAPRNGYHSPLDFTGSPDHDSSALETYEDPQDARPDASP